MPKLKSWVHNLPIYCHEIETGDRKNKSDTRAISCYKCILISPQSDFHSPRIYSTFDILSKTVSLFSVLNFENHNYIGGKKDNKNIFRLYFGPDLDFVTVCVIKGMVANCLCKRVLTVRHSTMYHSVLSYWEIFINLRLWKKTHPSFRMDIFFVWTFWLDASF